VPSVVSVHVVSVVSEVICAVHS